MSHDMHPVNTFIFFLDAVAVMWLFFELAMRRWPVRFKRVLGKVPEHEREARARERARRERWEGGVVVVAGRALRGWERLQAPRGPGG